MNYAFKKEGQEDKIKEFEELVKPLNDFLQENYHPHCSIIIEYGHAKIVEDLVGIVCKVMD